LNRIGTQVVDLNVRGLFVATQTALKHLPQAGRIIWIGSPWTAELTPEGGTSASTHAG
jgi:3-oxoacyl-[acyl-carrier protein] reductase